MRGVDILQHCEVTGIRVENGRATGVDTAKGFIGAKKIALACAGRSSQVAAMAGLRLPIESHVLQAFVSEGVKPLIDTVLTFGAGHFYISQSDKGGLVFGGNIDGYNSYAQRGNLPAIEEVMEEAVAMFPSHRAAARAAPLGRPHGHVDGRLSDHRQDADRGSLSQLRLVLWRLQGDAGFRLVLRASRSRGRASRGCGGHPPRPLRHRPPASTRAAPARSRTCIRVEGRCASPVPIAANAMPASSPITATRPSFAPTARVRTSCEAFIEYAYPRDNPAGQHARALVSRRRLPRLARRDARHAHP